VPGPNCTRMLKGVVLPARIWSSKCHVRPPVQQADHRGSYLLSMRQGLSPWLQNELPQCSRSQTPGPLDSGWKHNSEVWLILGLFCNTALVIEVVWHWIRWEDNKKWWLSTALTRESHCLFHCKNWKRWHSHNKPQDRWQPGWNLNWGTYRTPT
jgi:hypothetical protein